jgi:hypothetical protein
MICLALRTSRRFLHEDPNDCRVSNLGSIFEATSRLRDTTAAMISGLRSNSSPTLPSPLGYAGDVSQMYDKLPSQPVLLAVSHHLEKISAKARGCSQLVILPRGSCCIDFEFMTTPIELVRCATTTKHGGQLHMRI